tara:strand:+ start:1398 stop:1604 length:207 start_codon:yes stop_codon:yes gene_type:complete
LFFLLKLGKILFFEEIMTKYQKRQLITKKAQDLMEDQPLKKLHEFDALICEILKINQEDYPPVFLERP